MLCVMHVCIESHLHLHIYPGSTHDSAHLTGLLAKNFGCLEFKEWQEKAIHAVLEGRDNIIIQPTGSGKSLCFQFPPYILGGFSLVVTPTLSLIHDQVELLNAQGIPATYLCSTQKDLSVPVDIRAGKYKVVYVTPERLFPRGQSIPDPMLEQLVLDQKVCMIALDEAHCIFSWKSFR